MNRRLKNKPTNKISLKNGQDAKPNQDATSVAKITGTIALVSALVTSIITGVWSVRIQGKQQDEIARMQGEQQKEIAVLQGRQQEVIAKIQGASSLQSTLITTTKNNETSLKTTTATVAGQEKIARLQKDASNDIALRQSKLNLQLKDIDAALSRRAENDDSIIRTGSLFRDLLADLNNPDRSSSALLVLWAIYPSHHDIIVPAALLASANVPENLATLKTIPGATQVVARAEKLAKQQGNDALETQVQMFYTSSTGALLSTHRSVLTQAIIKYRNHYKELGIMGTETTGDRGFYVERDNRLPTNSFYINRAKNLIGLGSSLSHNLIAVDGIYTLNRVMDSVNIPPGSYASGPTIKDYIGLEEGITSYLRLM